MARKSGKTLKQIYDEMPAKERRELRRDGYIVEIGMGRPPVAPSKRRKQVKPYVDPATIEKVKAGIGTKGLGQLLDAIADREDFERLYDRYVKRPCIT